MVTDKIKLNVQAKKLGIEGYRRMSVSELNAAIASAKGATVKAPVKGKAAVNGTKGKAAVKTAVKPAVKKTAPAKSTVRKSTPKKATAVKGTAKRAVAKKAPAAPVKRGRGRPPGSKNKTTVAKAPARKAATKTPAKRGRKAVVTGRSTLDLTGIDWTNEETRVGRTGKRAIVLKALRRFQNYQKAFKHLQSRAVEFYPGKSEHDAERMLVWLIGRVAYDFAMATGQHEPGTRAGYGESDKPQDIRRRERREELRKEEAKLARAAKRGKAAPAKKAAPKSSTKAKAPQARRTAPVKPQRAVRKTIARKPVAKGKGRR